MTKAASLPCEIMMHWYIRDCIINADKTRLIHDHRRRHQPVRHADVRSIALRLYSKQLITLDEALAPPPTPTNSVAHSGIRSAATPPRGNGSQMADFERFARNSHFSSARKRHWRAPCKEDNPFVNHPACVVCTAFGSRLLANTSCGLSAKANSLLSLLPGPPENTAYEIARRG